MKLARNGKGSLRISLTREDLSSFHVSLDELDYALPCGQKILSELFDRARDEVGFDVATDKVYVQLYPKSDGGCELFIIRLEEDSQCFFFDSFEAFFEGKRLFSSEDSPIFYRFQKKENFLIVAPSEQIPPKLSEFGEKLKKIPSSTFLKSKCQRLT